MFNLCLESLLFFVFYFLRIILKNMSAKAAWTFAFTSPMQIVAFSFIFLTTQFCQYTEF